MYVDRQIVFGDEKSKSCKDLIRVSREANKRIKIILI